MFETPILLLIFNRLDTSARVFEKIKAVKPKYLYIAADGPREGNEDDKVKCEKVRKYMLDNIDWDCNVSTLFRDKNMGCGLAPFDAINWFFNNVEEGIILEDDCIPSPSFFIYCKELLEKYRMNEKIFVVGGNNFQNKKRGNASYYFSAYGHIWGWATWRRAWKKCNYVTGTINEHSFKNALNKYFSTNNEKEYWLSLFNKMKNHHSNDIWDFQWTFSQWINDAINIVPNVNLVQNIGFDENATHTKWETPGVSNLKTNDISVLKHPKNIKINRKADLYTFKNVFFRKKEKIKKNKLKKILLRFFNFWGYDIIIIKKNKNENPIINTQLSPKQRINNYIENGRKPWSEGYEDYKWLQIETIINDSNLLDKFNINGCDDNFGIGIDERIVEYPWIILNLSDKNSKLLDAGSTFNFKTILNNKLIKKKEKTIITYFPESENFNELGVSYIYSDLREIPLKDNIFDEVVCQSTLEHIDMDNSIYGYNKIFNSSSSEKSFEYLKVISELIRVLKDNGTLLLTVPFGRFENHGFFQQFDKEMIDKIKYLLEKKGLITEQYYLYHIDGWKLCTQQTCMESKSHNPHTGEGRGNDNAAHCRSVCCIKFIKNT